MIFQLTFSYFETGAIHEALNKVKRFLFSFLSINRLPVHDILNVDPIVTAASAILRLQSIAAREVDPADLAVVTGGTIHAGSNENSIPSQVDLTIDVRALSMSTRGKAIASERRIIDAESKASNCPKALVFDKNAHLSTTYQ
jgi:metal-dependent amidase/aminoacylase/carboxypeptidase family protein